MMRPTPGSCCEPPCSSFRAGSEPCSCLGVTVGTVKSQTAKALARLRTVAPELAELYVRKGSAR